MSAQSMPHIKVTGLRKNYGDRTVFEDIDLEIGEREFVTIVGPSGCGKTTLLRCIQGLVQPTAGSVTIDGREVEEPPPGTAMVFQHFGLFPWKTVQANVAFGLRMMGADKSETKDRTEHFLRLVGLQDHANAYPYQLSGGMQQRAGLARALALEPRLLIMDEPFGAIDAQTRDILQFELLRILQDSPTTMVFVTHSIEESVLMGDRVVILKGRPSRVFDIVDVDLPHPRTREVLSTSRFNEVREYVWKSIMEEAAAAQFEASGQ
jgi:NitT/TauT family transport system ATP-binding protein